MKYVPSEFVFFPLNGSTYVKPAGSDSHPYEFHGEGVDELAGIALNLCNEIERAKHRLKLIHAVMQTLDPESVCYVSVDSARLDRSALPPRLQTCEVEVHHD